MSVQEITLARFFEDGFYGVCRGLAGWPIEQPLDCLKTRWQASPSFQTTMQVSKAIYNERGFKGFYLGSLPNLFQLTSKQAYRFPAMLTLSPLFRNYLPSEVQKKYPGLEKPLTGAVMASTETFFITPLQRLKVWAMTNPDKQIGFFYSLRNNYQQLPRELFRGLNAVYTKSMVSWITFLLTDDQFKRLARKVTQNDKLSPFALFSVSISVGVVCTAVVMPFDVIKTQLQKVDPLANRGIIKSIRHMVTNYGGKALFTGWPIKMAHSIIQAAITVTMLEQIEQSRSSKN